MAEESRGVNRGEREREREGGERQIDKGGVGAGCGGREFMHVQPYF